MRVDDVMGSSKEINCLECPYLWDCEEFKYCPFSGYFLERDEIYTVTSVADVKVNQFYGHINLAKIDEEERYYAVVLVVPFPEKEKAVEFAREIVEKGATVKKIEW